MSPKARSRKHTHSNVTERNKTVLFGKEKRLKEENNFAPKTYQNDSNFPLSVSADCNFSPIQPFFSAKPALPVWIYFRV